LTKNPGTGTGRTTFSKERRQAAAAAAANNINMMDYIRGGGGDFIIHDGINNFLSRQ
jgi:hypothetical protein